MVSKLHFSYRASSFTCILFFTFLLFSSKGIAQCAGQDASITICDIPNPANQTVNLFSLLGGNPIAGGTWSDNLLSGGLNTTTGILNVQAISQSAIYNYTYTVTGVAGCADNEATITVTVGGYPGVSGPNASVCSDVSSYNLFQLFDGNFLGPQSNGTWSDDDNSGFQTGNFLNPAAALGALPQRTLHFTYTMPAIGSCLALSAAQGSVTIYRKPEAGTPTDLLLCDSDYLTFNTNLDLNSLLAGEDSGGRWKELSATNEITSPTDHFVNIQNIYNTFRVGKYSFSYTCLPSNPICTPVTSTVNIIIEKRLDFTGATFVVNSDICETTISTATYSATVTQGVQNIDNGLYNVTYNISGSSGGTNMITATFNNGVLSFPISSSYFQQAGIFTVTIVNITSDGSLGACTNSINIPSDKINITPKPNLTNQKLTIDSICEKDAALVIFSGINNLIDGNYQITYDLSGNNLAIAQTAIITVFGGIVSDFIIPASLLLKPGNVTVQNPGNTTITITSIVNLLTNCSNTATVVKAFNINPLPVSNFGVSIISTCKNEDLVVNLSGLTNLTDSTIIYDLSGFNSASNVSQTLTVDSSGNASFIIPVNLVQNAGQTTFTITNIKNDITTCEAIVNLSENFDIIDNCDLELFIPDGFSPNNDGVNDAFTIQNIQFIFPNFSIDIYNRYGNLMFKGDKNKPNWDGRNSESTNVIDAVAPNGVYFYVINFNKNNTSPKQGRLYLNR
jgi:gliding motility-associated-like protein